LPGGVRASSIFILWLQRLDFYYKSIEASLA